MQAFLQINILVVSGSFESDGHTQVRMLKPPDPSLTSAIHLSLIALLMHLILSSQENYLIRLDLYNQEQENNLILLYLDYCSACKLQHSLIITWRIGLMHIIIPYGTQTNSQIGKQQYDSHSKQGPKSFI